MKDERDHKTGDLLLSPNARRQAAYAERQRALGRKKFSYWMRPDEAEQVAALKGMVDAFRDYARAPASRMAATDLNAIVREVMMQ